MSSTRPLGLFEGYGIEMEYMIVGRQSLDVMPVSDRILESVAGKITSDVELGETAWSNELVLHVIELKTNGPAPDLKPLPGLFHRDLGRIDTILEKLGGRLMPSAMHPWMDPLRETKLWPHDYNPIYETYDRIFGCQGHGWSNLQSVHINLPFASDEEFGRLHAAIRLVLPLLPALAASSPIVEGHATGILDNRLVTYRQNQQRIPSLTADVIPEPVFSRADYEREIFARIDRDVAPYDPEHVLEHEWTNSRGAIARFDRDAIEIRVLDIQECPTADLATVAAIVAVLRALTEERWSSQAAQRAMTVAPLNRILRGTTDDAERYVIDASDYLALFGATGPMTAGALWRHLATELDGNLLEAPWQAPLDVILERGPLARRLLAALGEHPDRARLHEVYGELCQCLASNRQFLP